MTDAVLPPWRSAWRNLRTHPAAGPPPPADQAGVQDLAARLDAAGIRRLGRGFALYALDAGSCGGCELELRALRGVVYDLTRFGLRFVDSPRQAEILLVTGPVTRTLQSALQQAWDAMPDPRIVVAIGDCAIDGGVFKGSYAIAGGLDTTLPIDLVIRGCPPNPTELLEGLLMLLEANAAQSR